ncbi:phospholipase D family protein [bacterium]|nr:phospholipase D family protein [bacterium]
MAKFLNTSATNYFLEELIKASRERLVIISPFLKFNERMKELLEDKDRMKIDVRIVYGKSELNPHEMNWLRSLEFVRTSFCQNLHAKCYLSEQAAIITSMNLYEFSQINNNEMGIYFNRESEPELYRETLEEAQRLIRISEQVRMSAEKIDDQQQESQDEDADEGQEANGESETTYEKLTTSKLARSLGLKTAELNEKLVAMGYLRNEDGKFFLTDTGTAAGGELRISKRFGPYNLWPKDLQVD